LAEPELILRRGFYHDIDNTIHHGSPSA